MSQANLRSFPFLPLTIRIETLGGIATPLVLRGTPLPAVQSETFSTATDNQTVVEISLVLGESSLARNNLGLGKFKLEGIPPERQGFPQVRMEFSVDKTCTVTARAILDGSELSAKQTFAPSQELSDSFIAKILADAESTRADDETIVRQIEASIRANKLIARVEEEIKIRRNSRLSEAIAALGLALGSGKSDRIREESDALESMLPPPPVDYFTNPFKQASKKTNYSSLLEETAREHREISMATTKHPHEQNETQLHILRFIRTSPSRVSVRKLSDVLLYSKDEVTSALQVLVNERFVRQDDRDQVSWDHEQATYFTVPTMRGKIDNLLQITDSPFPRALRVFLCHSSDDKPAVRELYRRLIADRLDPWLDEEKLLPGQEWQLEILKAVRNTDVVIVCLSQGSVNKAGYVQKEIKYALDIADEQPEGAIFLIPLKLEECRVPDRLSNRHWVNYYEESGHSKLLKALQARAQSLSIEGPPEKP